MGCPWVVVAELVDVYEGLGYRKDDGRMVACGGVWTYRGGGWKWGSKIWGISVRRALWSLYYVRSVVEGVCGWGVLFGTRISQWSNGELFGVFIGVSGSPTGVSNVSARKSARDLWKEAWRGEGVAWKSPPRRAGVLGCSNVSRVWSQ